MTEPTPDPAPDQAAQPDTQQAADQPTDTTDWKAEARKWEQRAKDNRAAAKALEDQRKAQMTEAERQAAEAEERGYSKARAEYGTRLAQTEFRAAAAARNPDPEAATKALRYLNLSGLLGEDGEPDGKAIAAAVADLIPEAVSGPTGPPSFDGGARQTASAGPDMNRLLRQAIGRA
jgi:membrane protein involved in colicin uptake